MLGVRTREARVGRGWSVILVLLAVAIAALASTGSAAAASYVRTFSNHENKALADFTSTTFDLPVSGLSCPVTDVDVSLNGLNHTYMHDLVVSVGGPTGATVELFRNIGRSGDAEDTIVTFDDAATTAVASATAPWVLLLSAYILIAQPAQDRRETGERLPG
jgi:hypothetical protein